MMAMQSGKANDLALPRSGSAASAAEKPRGHEELGLCLALVVLLAWALYVGLGAVNWAAVKALLAVIF